MVEGEPDCRLVYAGGTIYMVDVGVPIDLDALASETAAHLPFAASRRCGALSFPAPPPTPPDISFGGPISPVSASSLAAKAAEIVPCLDSDEETLIFCPLQDIACILSAKQAMEGAKSLPTGHTF